MTTRFDTDTAVEQRGDGRYEARIDPSWWIIRGPNGGYVAAIILRALIAAVGDPSRPPRSITIHYLAPPEAGTVEVLTTIERAGRTLSTLTARLVQGGRVMAIAVAAFAQSREAIEFADRAMPAVPPPDVCEQRVSVDGMSPPAMVHWDQRFAIGSPPMSGSGEAVTGGWIAPAEPRPLDHPLIAAIMDAWAPPLFSRVTERMGVPTVDLTIHFRASLPAGVEPGRHTLCVFRSDVAAEGYVTEDGELWSPDGILLAESRQLAVVI